MKPTWSRNRADQSASPSAWYGLAARLKARLRNDQSRNVLGPGGPMNRAVGGRVVAAPDRQPLDVVHRHGREPAAAPRPSSAGRRRGPEGRRQGGQGNAPGDASAQARRLGFQERAKSRFRPIHVPAAATKSAARAANVLIPCHAGVRKIAPPLSTIPPTNGTAHLAHSSLFHQAVITSTLSAASSTAVATTRTRSPTSPAVRSPPAPDRRTAPPPETEHSSESPTRRHPGTTVAIRNG